MGKAKSITNVNIRQHIIDTTAVIEKLLNLILSDTGVVYSRKFLNKIIIANDIEARVKTIVEFEREKILSNKKVEFIYRGILESIEDKKKHTKDPNKIKYLTHLLGVVTNINERSYELTMKEIEDFHKKRRSSEESAEVLVNHALNSANPDHYLDIRPATKILKTEVTKPHDAGHAVKQPPLAKSNILEQQQPTKQKLQPAQPKNFSSKSPETQKLLGINNDNKGKSSGGSIKNKINKFCGYFAKAIKSIFHSSNAKVGYVSLKNETEMGEIESPKDERSSNSYGPTNDNMILGTKIVTDEGVSNEPGSTSVPSAPDQEPDSTSVPSAPDQEPDSTSAPSAPLLSKVNEKVEAQKWVRRCRVLPLDNTSLFR